jgi:hypothetical protein
MGDFSGAFQAALRRVCSNPTPTVQSELYWMRVPKTVPYPFLFSLAPTNKKRDGSGKKANSTFSFLTSNKTEKYQ